MPDGLILQPTYRLRAGRAIVQLHGRLDDGPAFLVEDDRFRPYFFVPARDAHQLAGERNVEVTQSELRDLAGNAIARVSVGVPGEIPKLRDRLARAGVRSLEADIRFPYRFLIDCGIRGAVNIDGPSTEREGGLLLFRNPTLRASAVRPRLSALSFDLETTPDAGRILSAALVYESPRGERVEEVHLVWGRPIDHPATIVHADESALLRAFCARIRALDPDLVLGWNVVDFDLKVLSRRCEHLGLRPRESRLGRVDGAIVFRDDPGFTRQSRAELPGRVVLDGIPLVRDAMRLPDYRLETVAREVLGRGKLIDHEVPDAAEEIQRLYREDPVALVRYNLEDARLVLDVLQHEGLLALTLERSLLSGMQLDRVGASIASFDCLYLPELRRRGFVAESVDTSRKMAPIKGGTLLDPQPGLTSNVAVFDFKSLYPSLVRTFHLDPLALALAAGSHSDATVEAPNGARFSRESSILPEIIERFMARREAAKSRGDRHADQAIKIMMNAMFGVFAASACRFFDPRLANAITSFGQQTLEWTRDAFQEIGVRVIYGDTDSVFVELDLAAAPRPADAESLPASAATAAATRAQALERAAHLRDTVSRRIEARIRREYGVEPLLTLELERVFDHFFLPRVRGGGSGSKKRYAGQVDGQIEIVGLEAVRRDWPEASAMLQRGMLERLFGGQPLMPFVREIASQLKEGALDHALVYVKRIRKGTLESYTASTPPHIQAARKQMERNPHLTQPARVIRYVITRDGPEPVDPGGAIPEHIDRSHYMERIIRPVADAILIELDQSFDEAMGLPTQLRLL